PAISRRKGSDETGIVVVGRGEDDHAYVLEDQSGRHSMNDWPKVVTKLYRDHGADLVVVETNRGGELPGKVLRDECPGIPVREVRAHHQKEVRADPVSRLYERGMVHHVGRDLDELEVQMTGWNPQKEESPDRLDALVWAVWELIGDGIAGGTEDLGASGSRLD